jgi:hypothetical protein
MFQRLKEKWKVNWWQFALIFTTFALGGSLCGKITRELLNLLLHKDNNWAFWLLFVPIATLIWPFCVLLISIPLGQYRFFTNYLLRMWNKIKGS